MNLFDDYYGTPINIAARDGNLALVKELLKHGANPFHYLEDGDEDYLDEKTPLHGAAFKGHQSIIEEILLYYENDAIVNDENETPLHFAADIGNAEAVKKLLDRGCKVNLKSTEGKTPLHLAIDTACQNERIDALSILLKHGADVNAQDNGGNSPLHSVVLCYNLYCGSANKNKNMPLQTILEEGKNFDFKLRNKDGKTALQIAIDEKDMDSARMIAKEMCQKPNITDAIYPLKYLM